MRLLDIRSSATAVADFVEELVRRLHLHLQLLELRCKLFVLTLVVLQLLSERHSGINCAVIGGRILALRVVRLANGGLRLRG